MLSVECLSLCAANDVCVCVCEFGDGCVAELWNYYINLLSHCLSPS
mgnify:CR=1 FL=1